MEEPPPPTATKVIVLTGGVAAGKSTVFRMMLDLLPGSRGFDADACVHELLTSPPVVREIRLAFGSSVADPMDGIRRDRLRRIIFDDPDERKRLEAILHPRVRLHCREAFADARKSDDVDLFIADIPLYYESSGYDGFDGPQVVVVAASRVLRIQRLEGRGLEHRAAERIIDAQLPLTEKMNRADHVIWNDGEVEVLRSQVRSLRTIIEEPNHHPSS